LLRHSRMRGNDSRRQILPPPAKLAGHVSCDARLPGVKLIRRRRLLPVSSFRRRPESSEINYLDPGLCRGGR
jgi:hypothetical protein